MTSQFMIINKLQLQALLDTVFSGGPINHERSSSPWNLIASIPFLRCFCREISSVCSEGQPPPLSGSAQVREAGQLPTTELKLGGDEATDEVDVL